MRSLVVLSSIVVLMLSLAAFGADGTLAPPAEVPGMPPPLPPGTSADRGEAPSCSHSNGQCAGHGHVREPAFDVNAGTIGPPGGEPVERGETPIDMAYDVSTDSIVVYLPDGSTVRRRMSELSSTRPTLPFRAAGRSEAGLGRGFVCDGGNCRLVDDPRHGGGADDYHFRPRSCPPAGHGCQGSAHCFRDNTDRICPQSYGHAPYQGYYRP